MKPEFHTAIKRLTEEIRGQFYYLEIRESTLRKLFWVHFLEIYNKIKSTISCLLIYAFFELQMWHQ